MVAENRELLRVVNAAIREIDDRFGCTTYHLLCECGAHSCSGRVDVPAAVYAESGAADGRLVVATGHVPKDVDRVVAEDSGYVVVAPRRSTASATRAPLGVALAETD